MMRSVWARSVLVFFVMFLIVVLVTNGLPAAAQPAADPNPPGSNSQGTGAAALPAQGEPLDQGPYGPGAGARADAVQGVAGPNPPGSSSQGTEAAPLPAQGEPLDLVPGRPDAATFYHIPGSVMMPVAGTTTLSYDLMGCVHAATGGSDLLNVPLDIPDGSHIILLRLYYDDTSTTNDVYSWITRYSADGTTYEDLVSVASVGSSGHGSNYGNLDHIVDAYDWSYILVARLNGASPQLQVCGLRVMYYAPIGKISLLPSTLYNSHP